jgi:hypothetical protein
MFLVEGRRKPFSSFAAVSSSVARQASYSIPKMKSIAGYIKLEASSSHT